MSVAEVGEFLCSVELFAGLDDAEREAIGRGMLLKTFSPNAVIFKQGDLGDAFYVIVSGTANVMVRPSDFIKAGDEVKLQTDLSFAGNRVPMGTLAKVDTYNPSRDYPYTVRVQGTGQRGRVLPTEIAY